MIKNILIKVSKIGNLVFAWFNFFMFFAMRPCWSGISKTLSEAFGFGDNPPEWLLVLPVIIDILIIGKLVPYRSIRYVMNVLPLISITIILILDKIFTNKKKSFIISTILSMLICIFSNIITTPSYLYVDYKEYKEIANKYKDYKFVFVCDGVFNHLKNIEELMIYEESLMIVPEKLDRLTNDEKLQEEDAFVLSIQKWMRK